MIRKVIIYSSSQTSKENKKKNFLKSKIWAGQSTVDIRDWASMRPNGCNSQLLRVNVCNPADLLQPLLQNGAVNKDLTLPYLSTETKDQMILYVHILINHDKCRLNVIKAQSVHLERHHTKWTHMAHKTVRKPFQCFDCDVCVCVHWCACVWVYVCFGSLPKAHVDKVWPHESPKEKRWKQANTYTYIFSNFPPVSLCPSFLFNFLCFSPSFSPFSLQFSLSLPLSCMQKNIQRVIMHVFIVFWQSSSSRNCFILSWRLTQTGSNCTVTHTVWKMKSRFPAQKIQNTGSNLTGITTSGQDHRQYA